MFGLWTCKNKDTGQPGTSSLALGFDLSYQGELCQSSDCIASNRGLLQGGLFRSFGPGQTLTSWLLGVCLKRPVTFSLELQVVAVANQVAASVDPKAAQVATGGSQTVTNQPWDAHLED